MAQNSRKILVIEDNQAVCQILKDRLTEEGFVVDIATDGEAGLSKLKAALPDLVLLDIIMPKLDGAALLKLLSDNAEVKKIPILVVTNISEPEAKKKIGDYPVAEIIVKANYTLDDIVSKVKQLLKQDNGK